MWAQVAQNLPKFGMFGMNFPLSGAMKSQKFGARQTFEGSAPPSQPRTTPVTLSRQFLRCLLLPQLPSHSLRCIQSKAKHKTDNKTGK